LEVLPADYQVWVVEAAGTEKEQKWKLPLEELDRHLEMSNLMSVYIPPVPNDLLLHEFRQLREIVRTLRGPGGCPWDKNRLMIPCDATYLKKHMNYSKQLQKKTTSR